MRGKPIAMAAAMLGLLASAGSALAQKTSIQAIEEYREMLQDGNPADLFEAKGEDLWKKKRGPKNASLEGCDLGLGPGVVKGAFVELPRWFADTCKTVSERAGKNRVYYCKLRRMRAISDCRLPQNDRKSGRSGCRYEDHTAAV